MILRVNGEYLEFNGAVELDRKAKLFEEMDSVDGDVSFEFELELTSHNVRVMNFPFPDNARKTVYHINNAELMTDDGQLISSGYIKPERPVGRTLFCSFWGGNNNWFAMITGNMTDLNLEQYDREQNETEITDSWDETEGIVFPLIDTGALSTRSYANMKTEDFAPCFYVKTLFFEIFQQAGLKLDGELMQDWVYNNMVVASNGRSQTQIQDRSSYVLKNAAQAVDNTKVKITFDDDTNYPYFDGAQDNFDLTLSRYTADIKMIVDVMATLTVNEPSDGGVLYIRINNVEVKQSPVVLQVNNSIEGSFTLNAGDYVEIWFETALLGASGTATGGTFRITPKYLYQAFASASVPRWTKQDFVSQVLSIFNVIPAYDSYTKTVTFNIFEKLKPKEPIDISEHVESIETDYVEFISDYAKNNTFTYEETEIDNLQQYNISTFFKYGTGTIEADNDFLEPSKAVIESDFAAPISYINGAFQMSMERIPFVELDEDVSIDFTGVSDNGGIAEFNIPQDLFSNGDLVRITDSTDESYNGEWVVNTSPSGLITVNGGFFSTNATGTITRLLHNFTNEDNVYLFLNIPNYPISNASSANSFYFDENLSGDTIAIAYFSLLNQNKPINTQYKQSLSFGPIDNVLFYQRTILETYWNSFSRIINDPVSIKATCLLPWVIHNQIDFLRPIMIKTLETTNLYYCNLERGYQNSFTPCELQLIKLP